MTQGSPRTQLDDLDSLDISVAEMMRDLPVEIRQAMVHRFMLMDVHCISQRYMDSRKLQTFPVTEYWPQMEKEKNMLVDLTNTPCHYDSFIAWIKTIHDMMLCPWTGKNPLYYTMAESIRPDRYI